MVGLPRSSNELVLFVSNHRLPCYLVSATRHSTLALGQHHRNATRPCRNAVTAINQTFSTMLGLAARVRMLWMSHGDWVQIWIPTRNLTDLTGSFLEWRSNLRVLKRFKMEPCESLMHGCARRTPKWDSDLPTMVQRVSAPIPTWPSWIDLRKIAGPKPPSEGRQKDAKGTKYKTKKEQDKELKWIRH